MRNSKQKVTSKLQRCPNVAFIDRSEKKPFHPHFRAWIMLIDENPTMIEI